MKRFFTSFFCYTMPLKFPLINVQPEHKHNYNVITQKLSVDMYLFTNQIDHRHRNPRQSFRPCGWRLTTG